jgi:hypothetical protein
VSPPVNIAGVVVLAIPPHGPDFKPGLLFLGGVEDSALRRAWEYASIENNRLIKTITNGKIRALFT